MAIAVDATKNSLATSYSTLVTHLSGHTADPGSTGTSEMSGTGYARGAITWGTAGGGVITGGGHHHAAERRRHAGLRRRLVRTDLRNLPGQVRRHQHHLPRRRYRSRHGLLHPDLILAAPQLI